MGEDRVGVGCHYSADADFPHFADGGQGQLPAASWTLLTCMDSFLIPEPVGYNLRHASEPVAHPAHRDCGMDEP